MSGGEREPKIVVVGSTMIDLVAFADRLPGPGETLVGTRFLQGFGGKGANQAVAAARFGASVAMVNAVGDDPNGRAILDNLAAQGVTTDDVAIARGTSGVATIWVDGAGMNRIIVIPGTNALVAPDLAAAAVRRIRPAVVLGQFEIPQATTSAAFLAAREVGATTILNPAPGALIDAALVAVTDWLVPNETEFALIGGRGVAVRPRTGSVAWIPAPTVQAVDTTGAGDAFVGAFAVGLALGWPAGAAATLGCAVASDSVTRPGTQSSYPDRAAAARFLADVVGTVPVGRPTPSTARQGHDR
ncbi:MAG TPA: ribokinase [Candidatus Limnocylindrales bacterium]|nr:ribokinase [Candidatus Limnocylindrales bacterium]